MLENSSKNNIKNEPTWSKMGSKRRPKSVQNCTKNQSKNKLKKWRVPGGQTDSAGRGPNSWGCILGPPNYLDLHDPKPLYPRLQNCKAPRLQDSKTPSLQALSPLLTGVLGTGYWVLGTGLLGYCPIVFFLN